MTNRLRTLGALAWGLILCVLASYGRAAPPEERNWPRIEMTHTAWTARDGVPSDVRYMAQTPDGWLWLSGGAGLFRFDGVRFERYVPLEGKFWVKDIYRMGVLSDGTLWIGYVFGGVQLLRDGVLRSYDATSGISLHSAKCLERDANNRLWLAAEDGAYVLEPGDNQWRLAAGLDQGTTYDVMLDSRGGIWIVNMHGVWLRKTGESGFIRVADQAQDGKIREDPSGRVWVSELGRKGLRLLFAPPGAPQLSIDFPDVSINEFSFDRDGNFWIPDTGGITRVAVNPGLPRVASLNARQGMSGSQGRAVTQDREGNVWVSTSNGLDQFRSPRISAVDLPHYEFEGPPLTAGAHGDAWIDRYYFGSVTERPVPFRAPTSYATTILVLHHDFQGNVWSAGRDGLWRVDKGNSVRVPLPPAIDTKTMLQVFALAGDASGGLWMSLGRRGLYRLQDGIWTKGGGIPQLENFLPTVVVAEPSGRMWFGTIDNGIAILDRGKLRRFSATDGLAVGNVLQVAPYLEGAVVGGDTGLAWFDGKRFVVLGGQEGQTFPNTSGIVITPEGNVWLNTANGIFGIEASELRKASQTPRYAMRYVRLDSSDGLQGVSPGLNPLPSMIRLTSGEIMASTTAGVFRFDPARYTRNERVPPVVILGVVSDGVAQHAGAVVRIGASPDNVRIDYTALSLSVPQRVRFRYMLDGVDRGWQDPGQRRAAFYTGLAPGSYRFRVIAANDDGVWNQEGANLLLVVPPTIVQTSWFKLLCLALVAGLIWLAYRFRLRVALLRMQRAFDERVAERERIARDLHDTLLQSVHGLILSFRRIALRTPAEMPIRPMMEAALSQAVDVMSEGRDKVAGLRHLEARDLGAALLSHGQGRGSDEVARFEFQQHGEARPLNLPVQEEIFFIGREAINNAFLHARAEHIYVELSYTDRFVELNVRDDGCGMQADRDSTQQGRWGIAGMRERAAQLDATLTVVSDAGHGTVWSLRVPARIAYAASDISIDANIEEISSGALPLTGM